MNSIDLDVTGGKKIAFKDGSEIKYGPHQDKFLNSLWGTLTHCYWGVIEFVDEKNGITATYSIGKEKKGKDYVKGEILKDGVKVSELNGSYMGYLEFDGKRYWDVRKMMNFDLIDES